MRIGIFITTCLLDCCVIFCLFFKSKSDRFVEGNHVKECLKGKNKKKSNTANDCLGHELH